MGSDAHLIVVGGDPSLLDVAQSMIDDLERRWSRERYQDWLGDTLERLLLGGWRPTGGQCAPAGSTPR